MRVQIISSVILFIINSSLMAQYNVMLNANDTIIAQVDQNSEPYYIHKIKAGETLYSLSKFFKANYKDLLIINGVEQNEIIDLGEEILIPINAEDLIRTRTTNDENVIPVFYSVRKSENLFRISHVYFRQSVEDLALRNEINSLSLQPGQLLKVGWWPLNDNTSDPEITSNESLVPNEQHTRSEDSSFIKQVIDNSYTLTVEDSLSRSDKDSLEEFKKIEIISTKGIAIWERSDENDQSLLVLHRSASLGSAIKLQNPVTDNIVVAQVVGHIPKNVYTDDVDIIISKAVAYKLGALDTRFQVLMTFYE